LCLLHFLLIQLILCSLWMWYASSLLSIIINKLLIDLSDLVYLISIDWTSLQLSMRCEQRLSNHPLFFQALQKLVLYHTILKKCWLPFMKRYRKNQCLFLHPLHQPLHIQLQARGLHLIILLIYITTPPIYVINLDYIEASSPFHRWLDHFVAASLGRAIAGVEAEETLHEHKKKAQSQAKHQSGTRRIVAKGGVLDAGEAAHRIKDRRKEEVEMA
jgi:hypothetical protein